MLNKGTADKVQIYTEDFLPALLRYMPLASIPAELGGEGGAEAHISTGGYVPAGELAELKNARPSRSEVDA